MKYEQSMKAYVRTEYRPPSTGFMGSSPDMMVEVRSEVSKFEFCNIFCAGLIHTFQYIKNNLDPEWNEQWLPLDRQ
jgi:hypothetical protein